MSPDTAGIGFSTPTTVISRLHVLHGVIPKEAEGIASETVDETVNMSPMVFGFFQPRLN